MPSLGHCELQVEMLSALSEQPHLLLACLVPREPTRDPALIARGHFDTALPASKLFVILFRRTQPRPL